MKSIIKTALFLALVPFAVAKTDLEIEWTHAGSPEYRVYKQDDTAGTKTFPDVPGKFVLLGTTKEIDGIPAVKVFKIENATVGVWSVRITAFNPLSGESPPSNPASIEVYPAPDKPGNVKIRVVVSVEVNAGTSAKTSP